MNAGSAPELKIVLSTRFLKECSLTTATCQPTSRCSTPKAITYDVLIAANVSTKRRSYPRQEQNQRNSTQNPVLETHSPRTGMDISHVFHSYIVQRTNKWMCVGLSDTFFITADQRAKRLSESYTSQDSQRNALPMYGRLPFQGTDSKYVTTHKSNDMV